MAALGVMLSLLATLGAPAEAEGARSFATRGYYITFMRMPTYGLDVWKHIVDGVHDDGGNLLILWVAGAYRSERYPVTWRYNADHKNVLRDFMGPLIDHAHARGVRVLLGFTPFGYDGVNQYPLEHPELRAIGKDGKPVAAFGIGCWGYNLCPSKAESQAFMKGYVRELIQAYPNADGLMIESTDYGICHCSECGPRYFEKEFGFVREISDDVWANKPDASIVVYPRYFVEADVPGLGVRSRPFPFDPRWTLFFTPHSAYLDSGLIRQAKQSLYWDDTPALHGPRAIQDGARRARAAGVSGYVPSLEAYSFVATVAEEGQAWLKGQRQWPMGFGWVPPETPPYDELPALVNRTAYREFSRDPNLAFEVFRERLGRELFGDGASAEDVDDVLFLQAILSEGRTWCQPALVASPDRVRALRDQGKLDDARRQSLRKSLAALPSLEQRHRPPRRDTDERILAIVRWIRGQWAGANASLLDAGR